MDKHILIGIEKSVTKSSSPKKPNITAEKLAYWFFRLNGCFTFENFVVHRDSRGSQLTDVDIIALRFLHRQELKTSDKPMEDYPLFRDQKKYASVFFVEVKKNRNRSINRPWRNPQNMQSVLNALGLLHNKDIKTASEVLCRDYRFCQKDVSISFAKVGKTCSSSHNIPLLTWDEILRWMHSRYVDYVEQKADHKQWDGVGTDLYKLATEEYKSNPDEFVRYCFQQAGISDC